MNNIVYNKGNYDIRFDHYKLCYTLEDLLNDTMKEVCDGKFFIKRRDGVKYEDIGLLPLNDVYYIKQINENEFKILIKKPYLKKTIVFEQIEFLKDDVEVVFRRELKKVDDIKEFGDVYLINNNELYNTLTHSLIKLDKIEEFKLDNDKIKFIGKKKIKVGDERDTLLFDVNSSDMTTDGVYSTLQDRFIPIKKDIKNDDYNNLETGKEKYDYRFKETINDEVKHYLYELNKRDKLFIDATTKRFVKSRK